jgi:hypothetical protein
MNNERRRRRDLEQLSTYLDNALSLREKNRLEARLAQEKDLRERLEQLRRTKQMVGGLPRLHAPRNFTLTPEMVTVRKPGKQPFFSYLRFASSLAAILLVVLFGVEFFLGGGLLASKETAAPLMESARIADEAAPEPLILWGQQGVGGGGSDANAAGMGGVNPEEYVLEAPVESEAVIEESVEEAIPSEDTLIEESVTLEQEQVQPKESVEGKSPILGVNTDAGGEVIERSQVEEQLMPASLPSYFRWAQISLAIIAIGGAFTLLILSIRRKRSRNN